MPEDSSTVEIQKKVDAYKQRGELEAQKPEITNTSRAIQTLAESIVEQYDGKAGTAEFSTLLRLAQVDKAATKETKKDRVEELELPDHRIQGIKQYIDQGNGIVGGGKFQIKIPDEYEADAYQLLQILVEKDNQKELDTAIDEFAALEISGVQAGVLSPILYFLHPDRYPVINSASREGMEALLDYEVSSRLADYTTEAKKFREFRDTYGLGGEEKNLRDVDWFFYTVMDEEGIEELSVEPSVWIEKTQIEGREYKQKGEYRLGNAIMAPSRDKAGGRRYEELREADVGDIVLHLLQDKKEFFGISIIESDLTEDFSGPPDDRWTEKQQQEGGYLRWLADYAEIEPPIHVYDDILENPEHEDELKTIQETSEKIFYDKRLSLNQGHYFTRCPEGLIEVLTAESQHLRELLAERGYDVEPPDRQLLPVESYGTISEATEDIAERLEQSDTSNWLGEELTHTIVADWSDVLTNFGPDSVVSATEEIRLQQIRTLYKQNESRLREQAEALGSGDLNHITKPQTLFVVLLRLLQEDAGLTTNVNQVKGKLILNQEYDVELKDEEGDDETPAPTHPLLRHLDEMPASQPVWKFTAPPDYWLTALQYGTVSFEHDERQNWDALEDGNLVLLHSEAAPNIDDVDAQPSGIFAAGILGEKTTKDEQWWLDETDETPFEYLMTFDRLYVTSNLDRLDLATPLTDQPTTMREGQLNALTAGILEYSRVDEICQETNGISFPSQGAHKRFRDANGAPDHDRPRALLEALTERLQETATINAHASFNGGLSTDPLEGLYFPDGEADDIIEQIETALRTGKHIILTGPPGTGKTEIARRVCSYLSQEYPYLYSDFQLTTATSDWSTFDTVGGYMPESSAEAGESLSFTPGIVLNRLKESRTDRQVNEPIIIDELNRADIDKAFGQLFTLLSGQSVQLPYTRGGEEVELVNADQLTRQPKRHQFLVPASWRIFATMNTYDKTSLYEMSYAFMRRFAFIRIGVPALPEDDEELTALLRQYAGPDVWAVDASAQELAGVGRVWRAMNQAVEDRAIGPAIVEDILTYVADQDTIPLDERLTRAVISYIFPQLEGVPKREQILRRIARVDTVDESALGEAAVEMLQVNILDDE